MGLKKIHLNEPLKRNFLIDNKQCLCDHGDLHTMISRMGKYTPGNVYNKMKEIFIKSGKLRVC